MEFEEAEYSYSPLEDDEPSSRNYTTRSVSRRRSKSLEIIDNGCKSLVKFILYNFYYYNLFYTIKENIAE
jgi:hypothetical protein